MGYPDSPDDMPIPDVITALLDQWKALRRGLLSAALSAHAAECADVRFRDCPNPECIYRRGLLDRTGGPPQLMEPPSHGSAAA